MGKRGPQPDAAQAAKGYPARRRSKADKAAESAAKLAALIAPLPADLSIEIPSLLQDAKYAPAAAIYRKLAPELRRTHRLPTESEFFFQQLCIYAQEWVASTEDLHINGFAQHIATVAGGKMERRRPATLDRQQAYANCMELAARFGLTPGDMYTLFKGQAAVAPLNPGLFGEERRAAEPESAPATSTRIGGLNALRSTPPGERPN